MELLLSRFKLLRKKELFLVMRDHQLPRDNFSSIYGIMSRELAVLIGRRSRRI